MTEAKKIIDQVVIDIQRNTIITKASLNLPYLKKLLEAMWNQKVD